MSSGESAIAAGPRTIGTYKLLRLLGEGGIARTYVAEHTENGSELAVKELHLLKSSNPKQIELFERECGVLKGLEHRQIPRFIETIVERRAETLRLYLVQELIEGLSLQQVLDAGIVLDAEEAVAVMRSCLTPLEYMHNRQPPLFHRDIKPSNVIIRNDGKCVLIDFGAVREALTDPKSGGSSVVGTFGYMAPEQFQARAFPGTDLYAMGAMAVHLATGIEPARFEIKRLKPDFHAHLKADPQFVAILDVLLEPAVEDRYQSARSLRRAIDRWSSRHGTGRPTDAILRGLLDKADPEGAAARARLVEEAQPVESIEDPVQLAGPTRHDQPRSEAGTGQVEAGQSEIITEDHAPAPVEEETIQVDASAAEPDAPLNTDAKVATDPSPQTTDDVTIESTDESKEKVARNNSSQASSGAVNEAKPAGGELPNAEQGGRQIVTRKPTGTVVPVATESAGIGEVLTPGGHGSTTLGVFLAGIGAVLLAAGFMSVMEYNNQILLIVGGLFAAYGLALALVPRKPIGKTSKSVRLNGLRVSADIQRIVKRTSPLGATEWIIEYEFQASDGLHYQNQMRAPSAKAARAAAQQPEAFIARYSEFDPSEAALVPQ